LDFLHQHRPMNWNITNLNKKQKKTTKLHNDVKTFCLSPIKSVLESNIQGLSISLLFLEKNLKLIFPHIYSELLKSERKPLKYTFLATFVVQCWCFSRFSGNSVEPLVLKQLQSSIYLFTSPWYHHVIAIESFKIITNSCQKLNFQEFLLTMYFFFGIILKQVSNNFYPKH
jgi:hypothetical protein